MSKPFLKLYIKGSQNDDDVGSCPICQKWFMIFYNLIEENLINFKVRIVDLNKPSQSYQNLFAGKKLPVAKVISGILTINPQLNLLPGDILSDINDLEDLLESSNSKLWNENPEIYYGENVEFRNLYVNFKLYLSTNNDMNFRNSLAGLNNYLAEKNSKFLTGSSLSIYDCDLMPKLQHIRIACFYLKGVDIVNGLDSLKAYVNNMYLEQSFIESCPSIATIVLHYSDSLSISVAQINNMKPLTYRILLSIAFPD